MKFDELPENYRNAINDEIADGVGDDYPEMVSQFKEWEAEALLGCEISNNDNLDKDKKEIFGNDLCAFHAGWEAREKVQLKRLF